MERHFIDIYRKKTAQEIEKGHSEGSSLMHLVTVYHHLPPRENMGHGSRFVGASTPARCVQGLTHFSTLPFLRQWEISTFIPNQMMIQEMTSFVIVDGHIIMKS